MNINSSETNIDIILPNYNSYPYIKETLRSILDQTFKNWKLFIVDANSNSETKNFLKQYEKHPNIKIIWLKKNKKAGFCRNLAMRNSKSKYLAFIDSDDIWDKEKLSKQLSFMIKNKHSFTYTNYSTFKSTNENASKIINPPFQFSFDDFIKNTSIATSTMMIKKNSIGNTKFSNTKICEDYIFKCQILKKVRYAYCLTENLTKYRIRKDSLQSNKIRNFYWIWYINKNYNKLNIIRNFISLFSISVSSIRRYGFK